MNKVFVPALLVVLFAACSKTALQPTAGWPSPSPSATDRPVTAAPTTMVAATAGPAAVRGTLTGDRYLFGPFGDPPSVRIAATGPTGWVGYPDWAMDGPEPLRADAPNGIGISFFVANGLYSDPCHWDPLGTSDAAVPGDVVIGPTVDDLVAAVHANSFYSSTAATPVIIDGYAGKQAKLQLPENPDYATCDKDDPRDPGGHVFVFSGPGLYAQGQANRWHLYVLDVEGTRLIAVVLSYAGTPPADVDLAESIIETMDINP
jgi:hypothetical protein